MQRERYRREARLPAALLCLSVFPFLDTRFLAEQLAQVEQAGTADFAPLQELYFADIRGSEREDALYPNPVGYFAYGEGFCGTISLNLDYIPAEGLDTLFIAFNNLIVHHDVITRAKRGEFPGRGQLFVYKFNRVHCHKNV